MLRDGEVSVLRLDEFEQMLLHPNVSHTFVPQSTFGAVAKKLISWVSFGVCLSDMAQTCPHKAYKLFEGMTGRAVEAAHPPARGRSRFFPTLEDALKSTDRNTEYRTTSLANYTPLLNRCLAFTVKLACCKFKPRVLVSHSFPPTGGRVARPLDWDAKVGS